MIAIIFLIAVAYWFNVGGAFAALAGVVVVVAVLVGGVVLGVKYGLSDEEVMYTTLFSAAVVTLIVTLCVAAGK